MIEWFHRYEPCALCTATILAFLLSAAVALPSGSSEENSGELVVLITDHRDAIDDFSALVVTIEGARLHRWGMLSNDGWAVITIDPQEIDLTQYKDGSTVELARAQVPIGHYDVADLLASGARGVLQSGEQVDVQLSLEPVRVAVGLRAGEVTQVTFDLVVQDLSDHPGKTWDVLIEEVRVERQPQP